MTTSNTRLITVTDDTGRQVLPADDQYEPNPGSIVLVQGRFGTAWQRMFSDGLWSTVGGRNVKTWAELCQMRGVIIVYDAEERTQR